MHVRIQGGSARHDEPPLCETCRFAMTARGSAVRDEIVRCGRLESCITFKVRSCSEYVHRRHPSLWHMEDVAWVLRTGSKGRQIGFVRAKDLRHDLRHVLADDEA